MTEPAAKQLFGSDYPAGKKLLICEEGLCDYNSHFYSWIKAIRQIHLDAGGEVFVAGSKHIVQSIKDELDVYPTYSRNSWSDIYNKRGRIGRAAGVMEHNWCTYRETQRLLKKIGPVDCILLPAVRNYHLIAWRQLCKKYLNQHFQRVVMFFLTSHANYNEDFTDFSFAPSAKVLKRLLTGFASDVKRGHVVPCGDSHITCAEHETLTGFPFRVFPSPGGALNLSTEQSTSTETNEAPTFVMQGVSFYEKGIDVFQTAILNHFESNPDSKAKFIVQWGKKTIAPDGTEIEISPVLRANAQVEILERTLTDEEYQATFSAADFLVLPYRRSVYFNRISGVAVEAACSGTPMIVTENTWLSWALEEFGSGLTIRDGDANDLAEKIQIACDQFASLKQEARSRQAVALRYNSAENYFNCVWG